MTPPFAAAACFGRAEIQSEIVPADEPSRRRVAPHLPEVVRQSSIPRAPCCSMRTGLHANRKCPASARSGGAFPDSVDSVLRAVVFKACGSTDPMGVGRRAGSDRFHEPTKQVWLHPCSARCCSSWLNHCTSHRDRRSDF